MRRTLLVALVSLSLFLLSPCRAEPPPPSSPPPAEKRSAAAQEKPTKPTYADLVESSPGGGGSSEEGASAPRIPTGKIPLQEILELKEKALQYKRAVSSPPAKHPGKHRTLPYLSEPQKVRTAVGYGTVIRAPFRIREKNGVVVGDKDAFRVERLDPYRVTIFPLRPFWASNLILFPESDSSSPVLLYLEEAYGTGAADYYVEIVDGAGKKIDVEQLLSLAETGESLGDEVMDALRRPKCRRSRKKGVRLQCRLSRPSYRVYVLEGRMECLSGCDLWVEMPGDATVVGAYQGSGRIHVCEAKPSRFAARECYELTP